MERRGQNYHGPWATRKNTVVSSLGFSFCLMYLRLTTGETGNHTTLMGTKSQNKPALSSQRTRKGVVQQNRQLLNNKHSIPTKHYRKNGCSIHTHAKKGQMGGLHFYPCNAMTRSSTLLLGDVRECQVGSQKFRPFCPKTRPRPSYQLRPCGEAGFPPPLSSNELPLPPLLWGDVREGLVKSQDLTTTQCVTITATRTVVPVETT